VSRPYPSSRRWLRQAAHVLTAVAEKPLYARVDGISRGGAFLLMELELIEPNLFLEFGDGAPAKFAPGDLQKGANCQALTAKLRDVQKKRFERRVAAISRRAWQ
jgi:hypothetical protein